MPDNTLTVVDNRTSASYTLPIENGSIRSLDFRQVKTGEDDFGLMCNDPSYANTVSCKSRITFIDGDKGILRYRGYPIEQLAERCTYLETADLLFRGELPSADQLKEFERSILRHSNLHQNIAKLIGRFNYDAHPMGVLISALAGLSTIYPESRNVGDPEIRMKQIRRLIAKVPIIAAYTYRLYHGYAFAHPDPDFNYIENFMSMLWKKDGVKFRPNPVIANALEVLFVLHADHEQNCSTSVMRGIGSALADPYVTMAGATAALSGPLHGGANEEVLRMLEEIETKDRIPDFIKRVKAGECKLMGFGHRIYKNYDPRARVIRRIANEVFEVTGRNEKIDMAIELERIALEDDYFVKRRLYPNVDFYSGIIYEAMGFEPQMFTVLFAIARTSGWLAQWEEMLQDKEQKIARPRQIYLGSPCRDVPATPTASAVLRRAASEASSATAGAPGEYPWAIRR